MVDTEKDQDEQQKVSLLQIVGSVIAAAFGVQSSKNRQRDFEQSRILPYIIAGIIFTALFIGTVYFVVSTVLRSSGLE